MNLRFPLLACGLLALGMLGACATQAQTPPVAAVAPPPAVTATVGAPKGVLTGNPIQDLINYLNSLGPKSIPDLQKADQIALAWGDTYGHQCYSGALAYVQSPAAVAQTSKVVAPIGPISDFAAARVGINTLLGGTGGISSLIPAPLVTPCSPLLIDVIARINKGLITAGVAAIPGGGILTNVLTKLQ